MVAEPQRVPEWRGVDRDTFANEVFTSYRPAVLKGVVADWPAVRQARQSSESLCGYLNALDSGATVDAVMLPALARGRIFYNDDLSGFNFTRERLTISAVNEQLLRYAKFQNRPGVVVQSALLSDCLPGFAADNRLGVLDESVAPRIWLGNAVVTPAHFDESNNIACVVNGRRRFTLFPPEQIANLYIGPIGYAPTGTPISLVSFREPDFGRFPRFREALAAAHVAELEPGDALFIPTLWWHHVESLDKHNVLVNYWWKGAPGSGANPGSALNCLLLGLLDLKGLPPEQREAWRVIFDHYVFRAAPGDADHIPQAVRGVLGDISPELARQVKAFLVTQLQR
jgi:Cupin-like domain